MKVVVVTALTPTPENRGGISAFIYSILRFRPQYVDIKIYSYNFNNISLYEIKEIESQLSCKIIVKGIPNRFILFKNNIWLNRYDKFLRKKPIDEFLFTKDFLFNLQQEQKDFILLYPYQMSILANLLPKERFVISAPDSSSLNRSRRLSNPYRLNSKKMMFDDFIYLNKHIITEKSWNEKNTRIHFVGMDDYRFYHDVTGNSNASFLLHPYVKYKEKNINFFHKKIKVITSGSYDMYYATDLDKMVNSFIKEKDFLLNHFEFTFLGKNWFPIDEKLKRNGFESVFKSWVDDYAEELVNYDIFLAPISFGTGTKGKVLDALVNGLLVIGSNYAFENICVRNQISCVRYNDASNVASILRSVVLHRERYHNIAENGRNQIKKYHDPHRISKRFFDIYYRDLCTI